MHEYQPEKKKEKVMENELAVGISQRKNQLGVKNKKQLYVVTFMLLLTQNKAIADIVGSNGVAWVDVSYITEYAKENEGFLFGNHQIEVKESNFNSYSVEINYQRNNMTANLFKQNSFYQDSLNTDLNRHEVIDSLIKHRDINERAAAAISYGPIVYKQSQELTQKEVQFRGTESIPFIDSTNNVITLTPGSYEYIVINERKAIGYINSTFPYTKYSFGFYKENAASPLYIDELNSIAAISEKTKGFFIDVRTEHIKYNYTVGASTFYLPSGKRTDFDYTSDDKPRTAKRTYPSSFSFQPIFRFHMKEEINISPYLKIKYHNLDKDSASASAILAGIPFAMLSTIAEDDWMQWFLSPISVLMLLDQAYGAWENDEDEGYPATLGVGVNISIRF